MNSSNILDRLNELSAKQRKLLARQIGVDLKNKNEEDIHHRLVAYVVAESHIDESNLIYYLKNKLPEYMVPANVVQLDEMPRLPNGKIDENNLPKIDKKQTWDSSEFAVPNTPLEKQLATIWEQVLNFEPVGIHDNFFEIGGDSILSIQVVAKARKAGIQLAANQLFEHQTIAELALFAKIKEEEKNVEKELFIGPVSLLPIQHWFFEEHKNAPHHWNQSMLLELPVFFNDKICQQAIQYLIRRHDALRLCFSQKENQWSAAILAPEEITAFQFVDLKNSSPVEQGKIISAISDKTNAGFDLERGSLFQAIYFDAGNTRNNQLLLVAHHLVVDNVSWQIILNDLKTVGLQLESGGAISLPINNFLYKDWCAYLQTYSISEKIVAERKYWELQEQGQTVLPIDYELNLPIEEGSVGTLNIVFNKSITSALLNDAHAAYNTRTDELLIVALLKTLSAWSGNNNLILGLERHGRELLGNNVDPSEIVGWMTAYFPLHFMIENMEDTSNFIKTVKEQMRHVHQGGNGYGMLRYLNKNKGKEFNQKPSIIFNYLGSQNHESSTFFGDIRTMEDGARSPLSERYHLLEINSFVLNGQLRMNWSYSKELYKRTTMEMLAESYEINLQALIEHCNKPTAGGYTPSDFSEAGLSQDDLDHLLDHLEF